MDLLDRFLGHDAWTTRQLLDICLTLSDDQLDREFDIGHRTLRRTLDHVIHNMEVWSSLMAEQPFDRATNQTIVGMIRRLDLAAERLKYVSRRVTDADGWDDLWQDHLDAPPQRKTFGAGIAHVITHSMHHRAQLLYMLRLTGVTKLPEGDVFSWENAV